MKKLLVGLLALGSISALANVDMGDNKLKTITGVMSWEQVSLIKGKTRVFIQGTEENAHRICIRNGYDRASTSFTGLTFGTVLSKQKKRIAYRVPLVGEIGKGAPLHDGNHDELVLSGFNCEKNLY